MTQVVAHLLHRQAVVEEMLGRAVAKRMGAAALADNPDAVDATSDDIADRVPGHRPDRGLQRQEQRSFRTRRTNLADVAQDRLSDTARQRIVMGAARLRAAHLQSLLCPVQVVEPEAGNLAGAQAVGDQQHENGPVAYVGGPVAIRGCKQAHDLVPVQSLRDRLAGVTPRRHDAVGKTRHAPASVFGKAEESPQVLRVAPD